jgi:signal transduction histidine kinase
MRPAAQLFLSGSPAVARRLPAVRFLLLALVLLVPVFGLLTLTAQHDDAILERAYLRDDTGQLTLAEVQGLAFTSFQGPLTQGFQAEAAYWLRFRIRADDATAPPFILRLRPAWHDDIRLFDPADPRPAPRVTGDRHPWSAGEVASLSHGFLLTRTADPRDIYLRVQSVHSYLIEAQALAQTEARRADTVLLTLYVIYMGVLVVAIGWAFASYSRTPDRIIGVFGAYQFCQFLYYIFIVGLAQIIFDNVLPPAWIDRLTTVLIIAAAGLAMVFHIVLLQQHGVARWCAVTMKVIASIPVLSLLIYLFGEPTRAVAANAAAIALFSAMALLAVWAGVPADRPGGAASLPRRWLRFFYVLVSAIGLLAASPLLAWLNVRWLSFDLYLLHSAIVTIAMGMFLNHRQRRIAEGLAAAQQTAELERRAREDQNKFVTMLNHELKTPLSVLKLLFARHPRQDLGEATIDTITGLIDRCLLSDRLDHGAPLRTATFFPAEVIGTVLQTLPEAGRVAVEDGDRAPIHNDPELFAAIVANLLDNALRYGAPGSPVTVSLQAATHEGKPAICLRVCNRIGRAGVPDVERVFDKYYRADAARSVPGTGLGLYLVKSFAEMMGGSIRCEADATATQTICFTLCLPR